MGKKPLVWKAERGSAPTFKAQLGKVITYSAVTRTYGHPAYVELRGPRGGVKRLDCHCLQFLPQPALSQVSGRRCPGMAGRARGGAFAGAVFPLTRGSLL
jgi:hypothetical protein